MAVILVTDCVETMLERQLQSTIDGNELLVKGSLAFHGGFNALTSSCLVG